MVPPLSEATPHGIVGANRRSRQLCLAPDFGKTGVWRTGHRRGRASCPKSGFAFRGSAPTAHKPGLSSRGCTHLHPRPVWPFPAPRFSSSARNLRPAPCLVPLHRMSHRTKWERWGGISRARGIKNFRRQDANARNRWGRGLSPKLSMPELTFLNIPRPRCNKRTRITRF